MWDILFYCFQFVVLGNARGEVEFRFLDLSREKRIGFLCFVGIGAFWFGSLCDAKDVMEKVWELSYNDDAKKQGKKWETFCLGKVEDW